MPISTDVFGRLDWLTKRLKRLYAIVNSNTQAVTEAQFNNPCFLEIGYDLTSNPTPDLGQVAASATVPFTGYFQIDAVQKFYGGGAYIDNGKMGQQGNLLYINDGCGIITTFLTDTGSNQPSLKYVNLPNITEIQNDCFLGSNNLTSVFFPRVETVGSQAFKLCESIRDINLPLATTIGDGAFIVVGISGSTVNINLPKVINMGSDAFQGWAGNTINLTIPAALENNAVIQYLINNNTVNLNLV